MSYVVLMFFSQRYIANLSLNLKKVRILQFDNSGANYFIIFHLIKKDIHIF